MKHFLIKTAILFLPIILGIIVLEPLLRNIPNNYSYKNQYLDEHATDIQVLILGSSHSFYGINPTYFDLKTFNAAMVSQSLDYDMLILNKYKERFTNLKVIVLPVSYFSLWSKLSNGKEAWREKKYSLYYGFSNKSFKDYFDLELFSKGSIRRLYSYYINGQSDLTCSELGWGTSYNSKTKTDLDETGITAAKRHTQDNIYSPQSIKVFHENVAILDSISAFCKKRKVKLILVTTPTYPSYRENLNQEQVNKMFETMNGFSQKTSSVYINCFENKDFVANDFFDADHLNEIGAEKLSKMIAHDIDSLRILQ